MKAARGDAAGGKRKAAAVFLPPEGHVPVGKKLRGADDARPGRAAEQPRLKATGSRSAGGSAQTSLVKHMPASAAPHEDDSESDEDAAPQPPVKENSRSEQPFLDEVLEASRNSGAQRRQVSDGKQRRGDRSGVVEVVDEKRICALGRTKLGKGGQAWGKAVASQPGRKAVRGSSAAQLLAGNGLRAAVATGAVASAWD